MTREPARFAGLLGGIPASCHCSSAGRSVPDGTAPRAAAREHPGERDVAGDRRGGARRDQHGELDRGGAGRRARAARRARRSSARA